MKKLNVTFILALVSTFILFSCGGKKKEEAANTIKVGITAGPEQELAEVAKKVAKEKYNLDVELVSFNEYIMPNESLNQGDIDVNVYQHKPFMDEQIKQRGYKLAIIGKTFVFPIVAYSKKIKSINELKDGSTIAIPNDPTNGGRSLLLLEKQGLIKLKPNVGLLPKVTDIVENPKKLDIIEIDGAQLPRVLDDAKVTLAIINNNFAVQSGLDKDKEGIFSEDKDSPYVNLVVSREDNKNDEKVKQFTEAYQSDEVAKKAEEIFKGGAVKGW